MAKCSYIIDEDGVAELIIDNPPMNAVSSKVLQEILPFIEDAINNDDVRVVIVSGAGKAFIAGADIKEIEMLNTHEDALTYMKMGQDVMNAIDHANKPFIAAINGYALGGGLEFALACHMRVIDEKAKVGFPEIKLGLIPGFGGTQRTPRIIGRAKATELILTGKFLTAEEALSYGLVNEIAPHGESFALSRAMAKDIALKGRPAVIAAIDVIRKGINMDIMDAQEMEREIFSILCHTENKKEGIDAFINKRTPITKDY